MCRTVNKIVILLLTTTVGCTAAQSAMLVSSSSMLPVLKQGDPVACDAQKRGEYAPGDIIAYRHPKKPEQTWIKTIVAVGGDEVRVRDQTLIINGKPIFKTPKGIVELAKNDGKRTLASQFEETLPNGVKILVIYTDAKAFGNFMPSNKVPTRSVFVLGNNRDFSIDSRMTRDHGTVPKGNIVCRVTLKVGE